MRYKLQKFLKFLSTVSSMINFYIYRNKHIGVGNSKTVNITDSNKKYKRTLFNVK